MIVCKLGYPKHILFEGAVTMRNASIFREHFLLHKWNYLLGSILLSISLILQLWVPMLLKEFTDGLQNESIKVSELWELALWFTILGIGTFLFRSSGRIYIFRMSRILERDLRTQLFSHWEKMQAEYYQNQRIGNLMAHAVNDVNILRQVGMQGFFQMVEAAVLITIALIMMAGTINLYLTLLVLLPLPGLTYIAYRFRTKIQIHSLKVQEAIGTLTSRVQEFCSGISVIKTYVQEEEETLKFAKENKSNVEVNKHLIRANSLFTSLSQGIIGLSYLLSIVVGSILVMKSTITLGDFVAFNTYLSMLIGPIENIGKVINLLQQGKAADYRIRQVLSTETEIKDEEQVLPLTFIKGNIKIKNLSFKYQLNTEYALRNINVSIPKGTSLAIVGKVGSGKSTLVNLLLRLYNPPKNTIYIDQHDIRDVPLKTLRSSIAYVPQDNFLFSETIKDNIAFDPKSYHDEQIFHAARQAHIYNDIMDCPEQFSTELGERGLSLSGGQRQRVSIARALIKPSPIMIFDHSLSAVDSKTEANILRTLRTEMKGRTSIIISHRISTIQDADQIIVMDNGEIVERGTHLTLLRENGIYKKMYDQQTTELTLVQSKFPSIHERKILIKRRRG
ncbi:ABC transporter ATP-binding protein/permease [Neobacillus cucumis]|uniref:ABC transporter ATP-binding protein n=1 Tax=Neobacillus cucumis TaxID=1740721 RepID=UPI00203F771F|nr:ABC transporter ATP-binding protein [Neobacillus cucumis]MCM3724773.1 ABC transporter ATP-binding protein/permease [Neobacillus cucumis]